MAGLTLNQRVRLQRELSPYEEAVKNAAASSNMGTPSGIPEIDSAFDALKGATPSLADKDQGRVPVKSTPFRIDTPPTYPAPETQVAEPTLPPVPGDSPTRGLTLTGTPAIATAPQPIAPEIAAPPVAAAPQVSDAPPRIVADIPTPEAAPQPAGITPAAATATPGQPSVANLWGEGKYGDALTAGLNNNNLMGGLKGILGAVSNKPAQTQIPPAPADTTIGGGGQAMASAQQLMNALMARKTKGRGLSLTGMS